MPNPPKDVKPGQLVSATQHNKILAELRRVGRLIDNNSVDSPLPLRIDHVWRGIVVDAGPSAEADYTDARYWIQRSTLGTDETDNAASEVSFSKYIENTNYQYSIITATNLAETRLDTDAASLETYSHRVQSGTPVIVIKWYDEGAPSTPRYFFWQTPSELQRMRVKAEFGDYLRCVTYDGSTEGTKTIRVAKPYDLRKSPFDGQTKNDKTYSYFAENKRTVSDSGRTYNEIIKEQYYTNSEIYASYRPQGDTGVSNVYWIDANQAGRRWTTLAFLLQNCSDSDDKMMVTGDLSAHVGKRVRLASTGETCWLVGEATCDCILTSVSVVSSHDTCEDCLPACLTLTRCSGETGGSATIDVRSTGDIAHATVIQYNGTCYTVGAETVCDGAEISLAASDWTDYSSCDACRSTCHTITCCDTSDTLQVTARGLLDYVGSGSISIFGTPGCWTVGAAETCSGHTAIEYTGFLNCSACNTSYYCYGTDPCSGGGGEEVVSLYSVDTQYAVGDIVTATVDDVTACYEITSVLSGRDACEIGCGNTSGIGDTTYRYYEIEQQTPFSSCDECLPCWDAVDCSDSTNTTVLRGQYTTGDIYKISSTCWQITGRTECGDVTTDGDDSSPFATCAECQSDGVCYTLTPCEGGSALLVTANLSGIGFICYNDVAYTVTVGTCTGSEVAIDPQDWVQLDQCNGCPDGYTRVTVVTAFDADTCTVTTQDICVLEPDCTS